MTPTPNLMTVAAKLGLANNGYTYGFSLTAEERRHADRIVARGKAVKAAWPMSNGASVPTYFTLKAAAIYVPHLLTA